jgi:putative sterol carrier protein
MKQTLPDGLAGLRSASAEEAAAFFAGVEPEALVAQVRETSDDDLLELIAREEIRPAAVEGILARLHEYALADRLAGLHGTIRVDLERRGTILERHGLVFDHGELEFRRDMPIHEHADVVLSTSILRFVRLVSGERNAGLEYLAGKLDIEGDAMLALAVGGIFRVPGTDEVAVDPTLLDPVEVATVLKGTSTDHLKRLMTSGFRPVVLGEIFRRLPDFVDQRKARGHVLTIGFRLLGNPSGEPERYVVHLADGVVTVVEGDPAGERDATVTCEAYEFLRLATGHLSPITGVLRGQLKVKGDKAKALQLSAAMKIPKSR